MKRKLTAFLLVVSMLAMVTPAYAEDATTGSMTVNYEYTAPETGGGSSGDTSTYTVNIPATVTNENLEVIPITVSKNDIPTGKMIAISVDWDASYDSNGYFILYKNKGAPDQESIRCRVLTYDDDTLKTKWYIDVFEESARGVPFAKFNSGSTSPTYGGFLEVLPLITGLNVSSGTYTRPVSLQDYRRYHQ
ncbi:MAG: hypothetical protein U9N81_13495 [Bacillota bacterium]|nr:hypothetical protein [Bacillota bacterium]